MAADIVKSADSSVLVAHDDDTGIGDAADEVIAGIGNLLRASGAQPHIKMDGFRLALEVRRVGVIALWQRHGFRNGNPRPAVGVCGGHASLLFSFTAKGAKDAKE